MPKTLAATMEEDALIQALVEAKGKKVELIAFGISYSGILQSVDVEGGIITIVDGDDQAVLEIERIESFSLLPDHSS